MSVQLKNIIFLLLSVVLLSSCQSERQLIWEENFDGNGLQNDNWTIETGDGCPNLCGWGNNEMQINTQLTTIGSQWIFRISAKKETETILRAE